MGKGVRKSLQIMTVEGPKHSHMKVYGLHYLNLKSGGVLSFLEAEKGSTSQSLDSPYLVQNVKHSEYAEAGWIAEQIDE